MAHPGKHPIDPETGLCDICDRDAIRDIRRGGRPVKRIVYVDDDRRYSDRRNGEVYHSRHDYPNDIYDDDESPRFRRPSRYSDTVRQPRRVVYDSADEEPITIRRVTHRQDRGPPEERIIHRRPIQPETRYFVENDGERAARVSSPVRENPRRYADQPYSSSPVLYQPAHRNMRAKDRSPRSPPPKAIYANNGHPAYNGEHRQNNRYNDQHGPRLPPEPKIEMYYLSAPEDDGFDRVRSPVDPTYDDRRPPVRSTYQNNTRRRHPASESMEQSNVPDALPTVVKRTYKKRQPGTEIPYGGSDVSYNGHMPPVRNNKNHPRSSSVITDPGEYENPAYKNPSIYFVRQRQH